MEDFSDIKNIKFEVQKKFYIFSRDIAKKVSNGEISFEEFLSNSNINFNATKIDLYFNMLSFEGNNYYKEVRVCF